MNHEAHPQHTSPHATQGVASAALPSISQNGITVDNFTLATSVLPMLSSLHHDNLTMECRELSALPQAQCPEAVFGSQFRLSWGSRGGSRGVTFSGSDALRCWATGMRSGYVPLKSKSGLQRDLSSASPEGQAAKPADYDWTFTSPYTCSFSSPQSLAFTPLPETGVDYNLLSSTDQRILFYREAVLYEDDLHDEGCSSLDVKVRAMPTCVFLRLRMFVRVDEVVVRNRDVRYFHMYGSGRVYRDTVSRYAEWEDLEVKDVKGWTTAEGVERRLRGLKVTSEVFEVADVAM